MKKFFSTSLVLLALAPFLLPAQGVPADALAGVHSAEAAQLKLQRLIASHPAVLLVQLHEGSQADGKAEATVLQSYKGSVAAGTKVVYAAGAAATDKNVDGAYILAMAAQPLEDGSVDLGDCLVVPRYTQGSVAQAAMHAALVRAGLVKVAEER